jgi:hypothetical protein
LAAPTVVEVVASLFLSVSQLSGYPLPREVPPIHVLSEREMAGLICGGPCGVRAFYLDGRGVYLRFAALESCERWLAREDEAYRVQNTYLSGHRSGTRFVFDYLPERCRDTGAVRN